MTRRTQLIAVAALCAATVLFVSAGAQAAPLWEVGRPWHALPVSAPETLNGKGRLSLFEFGKTGNANCKIADTETIENVANIARSLEAIDAMTAFSGNCFGAAIFPCGASEHFTIRAVKWLSLLAGVEDEFLSPELEVNCPANGHKELYLGLLLRPVLAVNKLIFSGAPSGTLTGVASSLHEIYFAGVDKIRAALWRKVR